MKSKEKIQEILESYDWRKDLFVLSPKDRLNIMIQLFEFIQPKLQRQDIKTDSGDKNIYVIRGSDSKT